MNEEELKKQIMNNKPTAKINENGEIELEFSENFYNILDSYVDQKKAEVKKRAFQVAILTALGIETTAIIASIDKALVNQVLITARAFLISGSLYITSAFLQKQKAQNIKENIEKAFQAEAEERYKNNNYQNIDKDGTINFDSKEEGRTI